MGEEELWAHPAEPPIYVKSVKVWIERPGQGRLLLRFEIAGPIDELVVPGRAPRLRANGLWKTTCFELFLKPHWGTAYREFNFSPSGSWAAYDLAAYRDGLVEAALPAPPEMTLDVGADGLSLKVALALGLPDEPYRIGLCAVAEERAGNKSYWALNHAGPAPDFHHPACFARDLPPAASA
jgi:hypothetical protein